MRSGGFLARLVVVLVSASHAATPVPPPGQGEGEVEGQAMVLQLTPRTQVGGPLKPGDKIVAYTTPYGVSSVQLKTSTALVP